MRVATRRTSKLAGIGLTAAVALGLAAGPALAEAGAPSEAGVQPLEVPWVGGPATCPDGEIPLRIESANGVESGTYDILDEGGNDVGDITIMVSDEAEGQVFSFEVTDGDLAVRRVFVKGGGGNIGTQNLYVYGAPLFTDGIDSDALLHAPVNPNNGTYYDLSHVDFCFIPDGNNT
jgi:hypothetical protein